MVVDAREEVLGGRGHCDCCGCRKSSYVRIVVRVYIMGPQGAAIAGQALRCALRYGSAASIFEQCLDSRLAQDDVGLKAGFATSEARVSGPTSV